jgi:hypothetical protein
MESGGVQRLQSGFRENKKVNSSRPAQREEFDKGDVYDQVSGQFWMTWALFQRHPYPYRRLRKAGISRLLGENR